MDRHTAANHRINIVYVGDKRIWYPEEADPIVQKMKHKVKLIDNHRRSSKQHYASDNQEKARFYTAMGLKLQREYDALERRLLSLYDDVLILDAVQVTE